MGCSPERSQEILGFEPAFESQGEWYTGQEEGGWHCCHQGPAGRRGGKGRGGRGSKYPRTPLPGTTLHSDFIVLWGAAGSGAKVVLPQHPGPEFPRGGHLWGVCLHSQCSSPFSSWPGATCVGLGVGGPLSSLVLCKCHSVTPAHGSRHPMVVKPNRNKVRHICRLKKIALKCNYIFKKCSRLKDYLARPPTRWCLCVAFFTFWKRVPA